MIKLNNFTIRYDHALILDSEFKANKGDFILVVGESGVGKSTFLNSLCLKKEFSGKYLLNNKVINAKDLDAFYYIEQEPQFIDQLRISEHISLFKNNNIELENKLKINDLLYQYPQELSAGEKKRVALYLALLRKPDVLIIDEPTTGLDEELSVIVSQILKEYSEQGYCVICSTHDICVRDYANIIYVIEHQKLKLLKDEPSHYIDSKFIMNKILFSRKHHILYLKRMLITNKLLFLFKYVSICIVTVSLVFNNTIIAFHTNNLNTLSANKFTVYNGNKNTPYSYTGDEYPISKSVLEKIKNIDHVIDIQEKVNLNYIHYLNENINLELDYDYLNEFKLIDKNKKVIKIKSLDKKSEENETYLNDIMVQSYCDIEQKNVEIDFNIDNGIFISKDLAKLLCDDYSELDGMSLQCILSIPYYDVDGVSSSSNESGDDYFINAVAAKKEKVSIPIKGILKSNKINDYDISGSQLIIFVPLSLYYSFEKTYPNSKDKFTIYWVINDEIRKAFIDEVPEKYKDEIKQTIYVSKWRPSGYDITVDNLENLEQVLCEIANLGLEASSVYLNTSSLQETLTSTKNMIKTFSIIIFLICIVCFSKFSKSRGKDLYNTRSYLQNAGLSHNEISEVLRNNAIINTIFEIIICTLLTALIVYIMNNLFIGYTEFSMKIILLNAIFVGVINIILPALLRRV